MRNISFSLILSMFSLSMGTLSAAVSNPHLVSADPQYTNGVAVFDFVAPADTSCIEAGMTLTTAAGDKLVPVAVKEWNGSDRAVGSFCVGRQLKFTLPLNGAKSGVFKLNVGAPLNQQFWINPGGYIAPGQPEMPRFGSFLNLRVHPAELVSLMPAFYTNGVIYLGQNGGGAKYGAGFTYLVYQYQDDGLHAWELQGQQGAYSQLCASAVTLTIPLNSADGYQGNRVAFVETIDGEGESFGQVFLPPYANFVDNFPTCSGQ